LRLDEEEDDDEEDEEEEAFFSFLSDLFFFDEDEDDDDEDEERRRGLQQRTARNVKPINSGNHPHEMSPTTAKFTLISLVNLGVSGSAKHRLLGSTARVIADIGARP